MTRSRTRESGRLLSGQESCDLAHCEGVDRQTPGAAISLDSGHAPTAALAGPVTAARTCQPPLRFATYDAQNVAVNRIVGRVHQQKIKDANARDRRWSVPDTSHIAIAPRRSQHWRYLVGGAIAPSRRRTHALRRAGKLGGSGRVSIASEQSRFNLNAFLQFQWA